jgi:hypothetical protein
MSVQPHARSCTLESLDDRREKSAELISCWDKRRDGSLFRAQKSSVGTLEVGESDVRVKRVFHGFGAGRVGWTLFGSALSQGQCGTPTRLQRVETGRTIDDEHE